MNNKIFSNLLFFIDCKEQEIKEEIFKQIEENGGQITKTFSKKNITHYIFQNGTKINCRPTRLYHH